MKYTMPSRNRGRIAHAWPPTARRPSMGMINLDADSYCVKKAALL
jgi:hypothetical protein